MNRFQFRLLLTSLLGLLSVPTTGMAADHEPSRRALLIACSTFPNARRVKSLPGTENDVRRFEELLRSDKYRFNDVQSLIGWTENGQRNPTAANIRAEFEALIAKSEANDQVFVLMGGHGIQIAADRGSNNRLGVAEEPDGLDEAFIPADYANDHNVIRDDLIGDWLDQLKAKGVHVWIVFDCCHSGSITRGNDDEQPRRFVTDDAVKSQMRATAASRNAATDTGILDLHETSNDESTHNGSLVALFAAQSFETTPEVTRPSDAEKIPENRRGLLSYHLEYLLKNVSGETTYGDLQNALASRYHAERGMFSPNPYFEGDLDRTVFGYDRIAQPNSIVLSVENKTLTLRGGAMDGVTVGTELAVRSADTLIGHIEATEVGLYRSQVHWIDGPSDAATAVENAKKTYSCDIVKQPINPWMVSVRWLSLEHDDESVASSPAVDLYRGWLDEQCTLRSPIVTKITQNSATRWSLCIATPETARRRLGIELEQTSVLLIDETLADRSRRSETSQVPDSTNVSAVYSAYPADNPEIAKQLLKIDLERLFRMQRLFQLAGLYGDGGPMIETRGISLDFVPLRSDQAAVRLRSGEDVTVQLSSVRPISLWYTVLLVQSNGLVAPIAASSIPRGYRDHPTRREIEQISLCPTHGTAAYITITVPVGSQRTPADFSYLQQLPIGVHGGSRNTDDIDSDDGGGAAKETALGGLFQTTTRSGDKPVAIKQDGAQIAVRSWCIPQ